MSQVGFRRQMQLGNYYPRVRGSYVGAAVGAHFEERRGTREEARNYTRKEDSRLQGPFEKGTWEAGGSGARNDLLDVKRKLDDGHDEKHIATEHFESWCKHYAAFNRYKRIILTPRTWKTEVHILWGDSGTGKSKTCMDTCPNAYWKTRDEWWDAYDAHEDVIIDDFYGWLPYDFLLRLLDRYPLDVPTKGGFRRFVAKKIYITSNKPPEDWYPNIVDKTPLLRRIDFRTHFNKSL